METSTLAPSNQTATHCIHGSLTGPLGIFVQASLAAIAFSALIVKRYCEPLKTRRPWKTWWLDTSKQAVGAGVIHTANVYLSEALFSGDPCTWYIISFMLDSTIGLFFICVCLKVCLWVIVRKNYRMLLFGNYDPPLACTCWFYQCIIYVLVIVVEKVLITLLTLLPFWTKLSSWMLSATSNAALELFLVMFLVPLVVNAFIFWVTDNYLKLHHHHASSPSTNHHRHYHLFNDAEEEEADVDASNDPTTARMAGNGRKNCFVMHERTTGGGGGGNDAAAADNDDDDDDDDTKTIVDNLL